jgi:hypothetical protein
MHHEHQHAEYTRCKNSPEFPRQKLVVFSLLVKSISAPFGTLRKLRSPPRLELSSEQTRSTGSISVWEDTMLASDVNCDGSCTEGCRDPEKFMLAPSMMQAFTNSNLSTSDRGELFWNDFGQRCSNCTSAASRLYYPATSSSSSP